MDPRDVLSLAGVDRIARMTMDNAHFFSHWFQQTHDVSIQLQIDDLARWNCTTKKWWCEETFWKHWGFPCEDCWGIQSGRQCISCYDAEIDWLRSLYVVSSKKLRFLLEKKWNREWDVYDVYDHLFGVVKINIDKHWTFQNRIFCNCNKCHKKASGKCYKCRKNVPSIRKPFCIEAVCGSCCTSPWCQKHTRKE